MQKTYLKTTFVQHFNSNKQVAWWSHTQYFPSYLPWYCPLFDTQKVDFENLRWQKKCKNRLLPIQNILGCISLIHVLITQENKKILTKGRRSKRQLSHDECNRNQSCLISMQFVAIDIFFSFHSFLRLILCIQETHFWRKHNQLVWCNISSLQSSP